MEFSTTGPWISGEGPDGDVVMSCRARLARNIAGFPFVNRASETQRREIISLARGVLLRGEVADGMTWVDLTNVSDRDRLLLVERHLISKNLAETEIDRAVAYSGDESLSVMINEEDHLRMQVLASGLRLDEVFERINEVDDRKPCGFIRPCGCLRGDPAKMTNCMTTTCHPARIFTCRRISCIAASISGPTRTRLIRAVSRSATSRSATDRTSRFHSGHDDAWANIFLFSK